MENGPIFGIDEHEKFAPASLLKVPIMIEMLKYAEMHPNFFEETMSISKDQPTQGNIDKPEQTLLPGETYSAQEVLRRMIVYSDNISKDLLYNYFETVSPGLLNQTFIDLGMDLRNSDGSHYITVKNYASLFRVLYNSAYLNREMSEYALEILSEVEFPYGIVAELPKDVTVAHKFGYLDISQDEQQLHDCGIVYHPKTPYLICLMTRGKDPNTIATIMGKVSKAIFDEVTAKANNEAEPTR